MSFTVFDTETTGFAIAADDSLIEIGAVHVNGLEVTDMYFKPLSIHYVKYLSYHKLTSIEQHHVDNAPLLLKPSKATFNLPRDNKSGAWIGHH